MSKYWRSEVLQDGLVADPGLINRELQRAAEVWNGDIDALDLASGTVAANELVAASCNDYEIHPNPFGSGAITFQRDEVISRDWFFPSTAQISWTAASDCVIAGAFEYTMRVYGQPVSTITYGWSVGVFNDGVLVGRTDRIMTQFDAGGLPFHGVVAKGPHTLKIGIRCLAYDTSSAANPDDVCTLYSGMAWWRVAKR